MKNQNKKLANGTQFTSSRAVIERAEALEVRAQVGHAHHHTLCDSTEIPITREHCTQLSDQIAFVGVDIPAIAVFSSSSSSPSSSSSSFTSSAAAAVADLSFCLRTR